LAQANWSPEMITVIVMLVAFFVIASSFLITDALA
jgi:hypothetical protein